MIENICIINRKNYVKSWKIFVQLYEKYLGDMVPQLGEAVRDWPRADDHQVRRVLVTQAQEGQPRDVR